MTKLGKAVEKQIAIFQLYMTPVAFFDILLIQKPGNAMLPNLGWLLLPQLVSIEIPPHSEQSCFEFFLFV